MFITEIHHYPANHHLSATEYLCIQLAFNGLGFILFVKLLIILYVKMFNTNLTHIFTKNRGLGCILYFNINNTVAGLLSTSTYS